MPNLTNAEYVNSCLTTNCGLVQNDGTSLFLLNAGGVLLLNDTSCSVQAGVSEGLLASSCLGTVSLSGAFDTSAIYNCGLLLNDGLSFLLLNDDSFYLLNDATCLAEPSLPPSPPPTVPPPTPGAGWAEQYEARLRQARWEEDHQRMELLERKKTRISMEIGLLRSELREETHPGRKRKLQTRLNTAMDAMMAIEDELQDLYIRMMQ
jgi:hypothetical protein